MGTEFSVEVWRGRKGRLFLQYHRYGVFRRFMHATLIWVWPPEENFLARAVWGGEEAQGWWQNLWPIERLSRSGRELDSDRPRSGISHVVQYPRIMERLRQIYHSNVRFTARWSSWKTNAFYFESWFAELSNIEQYLNRGTRRRPNINIITMEMDSIKSSYSCLFRQWIQCHMNHLRRPLQQPGNP